MILFYSVAGGTSPPIPKVDVLVLNIIIYISSCSVHVSNFSPSLNHSKILFELFVPLGPVIPPKDNAAALVPAEPPDFYMI